MSTTQLIQRAGVASVLCVLVLALTVALLRLVALPLALSALALDKAAVLAARPLTPSTATAREARR
ncbi:hypothetical protein [Actinomadura sp. DC4]|uniref:hypothetical protein n=1 Tax=Actinomadura sp. DC4 TaxID=3055069 RepID=UPI0025B1BCB3|nr:hypothetical protein [Actinomadura sp. DC4]MDN3357803.1 hypothetical protein [Actinomadura sp. DC4]